MKNAFNRDGPTEIQRQPTPQEVGEAQRVTGELLWLVTRTFVAEAAHQVWGYLANTEEDGLLYQPSEEMKPWEEGAGLQAFSEAILEEIDQGLKKEMISHSQAAVNICMAEGGSWRTRHLREGRLGFETLPRRRDAGEYRHKTVGINTTQLLEGADGEAREDVEEEKKRLEEKTQEKKDIPQVEMMLKMVVLLASFQSTWAQGKNEEDEGVGWVVVVVAWGVFLMVVGLVGIIRWTMNIIRTIVGEKEKREPEEEPQDEGEEETGEGRRMRRRVTSNPQSREETPLPSPVPNVRREGGVLFTPSPPSSGQRDGRPGAVQTALHHSRIYRHSHPRRFQFQQEKSQS